MKISQIQERGMCVTSLLVALLCLCSWTAMAQTSVSQPQSESTQIVVTQGLFAKSLVKQLQWERYLADTAVGEDEYIELLESMGISPLDGWDKNAPMTNDAVVTVYALLMEHENVVFEKAQLVCDKNVQVLNFAWLEAKKILNRDLSAEEFFANKQLFPKKAPQCPYGIAYEIKNGAFAFHTHRGRRQVQKPESNIADLRKMAKEDASKEDTTLDVEKAKQEKKKEISRPGREIQTQIKDIDLLRK